jgi:hypothetical protein
MNLQELVVPFSVESSKAMSGLDGFTAKLKETEGSVTGGLSVIGGAFLGVGVAAIAGFTGFLVASTVKAAEAQQTQAQLAAVLKSTGGAAGMTAKAVNDLADSLSNNTKFEADSIVSTENLLLTFTNIGKNIFPQVTETALDMATALKEDTQSAAMQLGKALNDPIKGMTALSAPRQLEMDMATIRNAHWE